MSVGKPRTVKFEEALRLMRSRNSLTAEEGFHLLRAMAADHTRLLIMEFEAEPRHDMRCWLLELIGEARDETALGVLVREARSSDVKLRSWAVRGLQALETPAARRALYELQL